MQTASKAVLVKIRILETGCSNPSKGFTLIELLVSIIIIGLVSSIVFINSNVVNSFERNTSSLKNLFQFLSEESMLSGSIIGWHSSNNQSIAYYLDNSGKRVNDKKIKIPKSNWNNWAPYKKIFITSEGIELIINDEFFLNPAIIFFPDGQNSGGIIKIEFENSIYIINIDKNGQITTSYEKY